MTYTLSKKLSTAGITTGSTYTIAIIQRRWGGKTTQSYSITKAPDQIKMDAVNICGMEYMKSVKHDQLKSISEFCDCVTAF